MTRGSLADWRERLPDGGVLEMHQETMRLTLEVVGETLFGQRLSVDEVDVSGRAFGEALLAMLLDAREEDTGEGLSDAELRDEVVTLFLPVSYLTHRHSDFWDEPQRFDPDRFSPERSRGRHHWAYFPFSLGARMCIGNIFSLVEAQIVLAMLVQKADFELALKSPVRPVPHATLRPSGPVHVRIRWRD